MAAVALCFAVPLMGCGFFLVFGCFILYGLFPCFAFRNPLFVHGRKDGVRRSQR